MPQVNNIAHLREWFRECPLLSNRKRFRVNFVTETPMEYSIMESPTVLQSRENVLGEVVLMDTQTQNYVFMVRDDYGSDAALNIERSGFYQDIVLWILEKNQKREFPKINEGTVKAIVPTLTPMFSEASPDSILYQIQIQVTYKIE